MSSLGWLLCLGLLQQTASQTDVVYESEKLANTSNVVVLGGLFAVHGNYEDGSCSSLSDGSVQRVESMAYAIDEINTRTDLLPNVTLSFTIRDTCGNSRYGLDQAFHFVQAADRQESCSNNRSNVSVSGVVGAQFSRVSINVANLLRLYRIPQISYISTADQLGDKSRFDYFFRTIPPDGLQARAIADIIFHYGWTYVYALFSNDAYGIGGIEALEFYLSENNETCVAKRIALPVQESPEHEYISAVEILSQDFISNASVAVIFGQLETAVGIMKAVRRARDNGMSALDNMTWIGTDTWGDSLPNEYRPDAGGILSVLPRAEKDQRFDDYYLNLRPNMTSNQWFDMLWGREFNCSSSESSCSSDNVLDREAHEQASQLTLVTDAVYAFAHAIHHLVETNCSNGVLCDTILEDRLLGSAINGELLQEALYNVNFTGSSSNQVAFNRSGETGAFFIKNLQNNQPDEYTFETVGSWDNVLSIESPIQWVTGDTVPLSRCSEPCPSGYHRIVQVESRCCWACEPCQSDQVSDGVSCRSCSESEMADSTRTACTPIPITFLHFSHSWSLVLLIIASIGLVATISVMVVFAVCYKNKIVKASSREISTILLLGLILCYVMPFLFVAKPSPATCAIRRFGVGFSFSVCFSALLVKTNRIYRIFNQKLLDPRKPPRFTGPVSQVVLTTIFISVQVVMATVWLAVRFPMSDVVYKQKSAELICKESPEIYLAVSLSYNFILLVFSTFFAFLARKVPANFNEARYINVTLYTLCIIWIAFIPIYVSTLQFGAIFQTTSFIVAIILSASTTLVCIFVPKIYLMITRQRKKNQGGGTSTFATNRKESSSNK